MTGHVEVYVCSCGNAVTAATVESALPREGNFRIVPAVLCPCRGSDADDQHKMRREVFDVATSLTRKMSAAHAEAERQLREHLR